MSLIAAKEAFEKPAITAEQTARIFQAQNVADHSLKGVQISGGALLGINCFEVCELTLFAAALEDMQKLRADPTEFKSALSNKLKMKYLATPSDSSLKKKKNEAAEAKVLPIVSSSTAHSIVVATFPAPTAKVVIIPRIHPAEPDPVPFLASGTLSASEPFEPADYLDVLKAGFQYAKEFSYAVHEALLDHPRLLKWIVPVVP